MAGETILIVEDVPESLKFAAGVLRGAGYRVQIASTAEQALSTLRFLIPNLILVDFVLPGMNGLELTERIKKDARMEKTIVVALTGCAMPGDEERARKAGCDGYLTKPIDARDLAERVADYLLHGGEPPSYADRAERASRQELLSDNALMGLPSEEVDELRESFLTGGRVLSRQLLAALDGQFDDAKAGRQVHQWIGTAGLLGFPRISMRSRDVETILRTPPWTVGQLRGPLTNLARAFQDPAITLEPVIPPTTIRELTGKRIALIGLSATEAERMCNALERVGARARLFETGQSPYVEAVSNCHVLVIHVRPGTVHSRWLAPDAIALPSVPTIFIGEPEQLAALDPKVHARACGLLMDGWMLEEGLMRLKIALTPSGGASRQVFNARGMDLVIADSDETGREALRSRLEKDGFQCHIANNGPDALLLLRHLRPRAAVVDVGMDGFEVLAAIRAEMIPSRSILLTPGHQDGDILRGVSLGTDDYLVQPFSPVELAARLKRVLA